MNGAKKSSQHTHVAAKLLSYLPVDEKCHAICTDGEYLYTEVDIRHAGIHLKLMLLI